MKKHAKQNKRTQTDGTISTRFSLNEVDTARIRMLKAQRALEAHDALVPDDKSKKRALLVRNLNKFTAAFEFTCRFLPEHKPKET